MAHEDHHQPSAKEADAKPELKVRPDANNNTAGDTNIIGTTIADKYKIQYLIASGGMSKVYKAKDLESNEIVAIKILSPRFSHDSDSVARFIQEAEASKRLKHENICEILELGYDNNNHPFMAMKYLEGQSLRDRLKDKGKLEFPEAFSIFFQLANAIDHAHDNGIIHRDIKPNNVKLIKEPDGSLTVKILDFGIAKVLREDESGPNQTTTGEVFGTPNYMSPEQCRGNSIDKRCDIYSMGCVLYELLVGKPPFSSHSKLDVLIQHVNDPPPPIKDKDVPGALKTIVNKCLAKDPDKRYQSTKDLIGELFAFDAGIEPPPKTLANMTPEERIKFGLIACVVGVVAFFVFAAFILVVTYGILVMNNPPPQPVRISMVEQASSETQGEEQPFSNSKMTSEQLTEHLNRLQKERNDFITSNNEFFRKLLVKNVSENQNQKAIYLANALISSY